MGDLVVWIVVFALYFLPSMVAGGRNHPNSNGIGVFNLLLGWTVLGWVVALVWSMTSPAKPPSIEPPRRDEKDCPMCGERILSVAKKCKHCGSDLSNQKSG